MHQPQIVLSSAVIIIAFLSYESDMDAARSSCMRDPIKDWLHDITGRNSQMIKGHIRSILSA